MSTSASVVARCILAVVAGFGFAVNVITTGLQVIIMLSVFAVGILNQENAFQMIRFSERMAAGVLARGADYLGYAPVGSPTEADFLIDLRIDEYGILADSWDNATYFVVKGEIWLVDNQSKEIIWKKRVRDRELVTDNYFLGVTVGNVMTARMLAALSSEEMAAGLERLADGSAERLSRTLLRDYAHSRR